MSVNVTVRFHLSIDWMVFILLTFGMAFVFIICDILGGFSVVLDTYVF